ncbi:MAG: aminoacyl-tRNA hydrolase [Isosphaeraceae bacterium]|jgi:ribosome-associated protein|nr:MAG: aminoacyl-tRNA hydrolase [Isosphaeraceae bacterium]
MMIVVNDRIQLDAGELSFEFVRAGGPGGQNVNKLATSVRLRFDARNSPSLPPEVRDRLLRLVGKRADETGVLTVVAREHRTQEANRRAAVERLVEWIDRASEPPVPRRPTRPTRASVRRRLEEKAQRRVTKGRRRAVADE